MNLQEQVEKIKRQLSLDDHSDDLVLADLFQDWLDAALSICNRSEPTRTILAIVRDVAAAAYRRRGGEGMTGHSAGGQSYSYESLRKELSERLIQAGQRVYKL